MPIIMFLVLFSSMLAYVLHSLIILEIFVILLISLLIGLTVYGILAKNSAKSIK